MKNLEFLISFLLLTTLTEVLSQCNVCNTATRFACFSQTQYVPCDANGVLNLPAIGTCAAGLVCVDRGTAVLTSPCVAPGVATCNTPFVPLATTTTTTPKPPPFVINSYCGAMGGGRFVNPTIATCVSYVNCYEYNGNMIGAIYKCPGTTLFNPSTAYCESGYTC